MKKCAMKNPNEGAFDLELYLRQLRQIEEAPADLTFLGGIITPRNAEKPSLKAMEREMKDKLIADELLKTAQGR